VFDEAAAIREFLGDRPDSDQLNDWRTILEERAAALDAERLRSGDPARFAHKIEQLRRQIAALEQEAAITGFVEDSVRVTLAMGQVADPVDEEA
jgi:hypothetical protein